MSKVYIAGKIDSSESAIASFAKALEDRGHSITLKWWELDPIARPYLEHPETSSAAARKMVEAVLKCDVFILFANDAILGAAVEFGVALGECGKRPDREILVICPPDKRQSVFYAHPSVTVIADHAAIRERSWY